MATRIDSSHLNRATAHRALRLAAVVVGVAAAVAAVAVLGGTGSESAATAHPEPAELQKVRGEMPRVKLTPRAAERLGIEVARVSTAPGATVVGYSALLYDPDGHTWVYASPEPKVFVRMPVVVERVVGQYVVLSAGPAAGTKVVVVGAAELYGVEEDVGH